MGEVRRAERASAIGLALCVAIGAAAAAPPPPAPTSSPPPLQRGTVGTKAIIDQATSTGLKSCAEPFGQLVQFLGANAGVGAQLFFPQGIADISQTSLSMEVAPLATPNESFASLTVAPVLAGQCAFSYDTVTYFPSACGDVSKQVFPQMEPEGVLLKNVAVLRKPGPASLMRVYLMPAGPGCVAIKKEVRF